MSNRDAAAAQPSGVSTVPPATPMVPPTQDACVVILRRPVRRTWNDTTCDDAEVVRARAVPPAATAATATSTATMTRARVNKPDIPRTVPTLGRAPRAGERVRRTTENV